MKKILALMLALVMLMSLAACNEKDDNSSDDGTKASDASQQSGTESRNDGNNDNDNDNGGDDESGGSITSSKVEIKGDSVIKTTPVTGGGYQTVEYIFDGDTLKSVKLTSVSSADISKEAFNELKPTMEQQGYTDIKLSGKTITCVCNDIPSSAFSVFSGYSKENLKTFLESGESEENQGSQGGMTADYSIDWSDIAYIPDGMPELADGVSTDLSNADTKSFSVGWNVLDKNEMIKMKTKLEAWANATLEDLGMPGGSAYMYAGDEMMIAIYYYDTTMTGMEQCTVTVSVY